MLSHGNLILHYHLLHLAITANIGKLPLNTYIICYMYKKLECETIEHLSITALHIAWLVVNQKFKARECIDTKKYRFDFFFIITLKKHK